MGWKTQAKQLRINMTAEIEIAGEYGGPNIESVLIVSRKVLRPAAMGLLLHSMDSRVKHLTMILRVSGSLKKYEGNPVEEVKFGRSREWISVDLLLWERDWQGRTYSEIADVLCDRVRLVPFVVAAACRVKKVAVDEGKLRLEMDDFIKVVYTYVNKLPQSA
jgi:hypothetical protein